MTQHYYWNLVQLYRWLVPPVILLYGLDCCLISVIRARGLRVHGNYADLHSGLGLPAYITIKTLFVTFLVYGLLKPPSTRLAPGFVAIGYCFCVFQLLAGVLETGQATAARVKGAAVLWAMAPITLAVGTLLLGILVFLDSKIHSVAFQYTWDISPLNIPLGLALMAGGGYVLWLALRRLFRVRK